MSNVITAQRLLPQGSSKILSHVEGNNTTVTTTITVVTVTATTHLLLPNSPNTFDLCTYHLKLLVPILIFDSGL